MKQKILGIDASSTTIGLALLEHEDHTNFQVLKLEFYKPPKEGEIFERLSQVKTFITQILKDWQPDEVVVEDILLSLPGKTTIKTISLLAIFNRIVGLTIYEVTGKSPALYSPMKIRHAIKLNKVFPAKEEVPTVMETNLGYVFPWYMKKTRKNKNKPNAPEMKAIAENYDMADALAAAYTYVKVHRPVEPKPAKISKKATATP